MSNVHPSASYLFPNDCPSKLKHWGFLFDLPSKMTVGLQVPETKLCQTCKSFIIPQFGKCPICDPPFFMSSVNQSGMLDFIINKQNSSPQPNLICFTIDLNIRDETIHDLINCLCQDSFLSDFKNSRFFIVFIAKMPIYVSKLGDSLHLSFGSIFQSDSQIMFTSSELPTVLKDALFLARSSQFCAYDQCNGGSFLDFLKTLSQMELGDLVFFHSFLLPQSSVHIGFPVLCVNVSDNPVMTRAHANGWSSCATKHIGPSFIAFLSRKLSENRNKAQKLKLHISKGLEMRWICDQIQETNTQCTQWEGAGIINGTAVTCVPTSQYSSKSVFTLQISYHLSDGRILVSTRGYIKANNVKDFLESSNVLAAAGLYFWAQAAKHLYPQKWSLFDKTSQWPLSCLPSNLCRNAATKYDELIGSGKDRSGELPPEIAELINRMIIGSGYTYTGDIVNALLNPAPGGCVYLPPLVLFPRGSQPPDNSVLEDRGSSVPLSTLDIAPERFVKVIDSLRLH